MVDETRFLAQRFNGVVIAIKGVDGAENKPIRVSRFYNDDNGNVVLRYFELGDEEEKDVIFNEDNYILDCPQVGMVDVAQHTVYLRRVPERQWKRGYTENVVRAENISGFEMREVGIPHLRLNSNELIKFIYNPKYTSMVDGLRKMEEGENLSFSVSRKFSISIRFKCKFPVIHYKEWAVGWVDGGVACLPKETHHLFEELSQYTVCRRV